MKTGNEKHTHTHTPSLHWASLRRVGLWFMGLAVPLSPPKQEVPTSHSSFPKGMEGVALN